MDDISKQILRSDHFVGKLFVAGLLLYSIVGIPFFVGYLARYIQQIRDTGGDYTLPAWNDWLALLMESWELLLIVLAYGLVPMAILAIVSSSIGQSLGIFWALAWLPLSFAAVYVPAIISLAYYRFIENDNIRHAFDLRSMLPMLTATAIALFPSTLLFWGALLVGFPLLGLSAAVAALFYFPHSLKLIDLQIHTF
jgi:hypothetical protein